MSNYEEGRIVLIHYEPSVCPRAGKKYVCPAKRVSLEVIA